ncbi:putative membrane protein YqgA involved in biofilm formation [Clostridium algifaecis]|uniref:Membrane protein YqgA involved in biofilm formation n=2 Tax=Clostridium algifaecis TaxID=1472040 RepID=A0ABS4KRV6_9CLOT|nr:putative membrane protein YqgA involved in biofilm formation [Clostridium algifaecis]
MGSLIGLLLKKGVPKKISTTVIQGVALCTIYIGIAGLTKDSNIILIIISIVIGGFIGELIDIDNLLQKLGDKIGDKFKSKNAKISEGFVTASLLFCVGSMAIVGSLESGLEGNNKILFAKSMLDCITSIIFTSSLGIGVMLSSVSVLIYQGIITIAAFALKAILIQSVITNMTAVGSLLIIGLGFNLLDITKIKIANLLPAVFIPVFYQLFLNLMK